MMAAIAGRPVDAAILQAAGATGFDRPIAAPDTRPPAAVVPFSSDRKFMAVLSLRGRAPDRVRERRPARMIDAVQPCPHGGRRAARWMMRGREELIAVNDDLAPAGCACSRWRSGKVEGPPRPICAT